LTKKKWFPSKRSGSKRSGYKDKKDDQKGFFNCKKHGYFKADYLEMQKYKLKKRSFKRENFKSKVEKSFMTTWDQLDKEIEYAKR